MLGDVLRTLRTRPVSHAQLIENRYRVSRRQANQLLKEPSEADVLSRRILGPG